MNKPLQQAIVVVGQFLRGGNLPRYASQALPLLHASKLYVSSQRFYCNASEKKLPANWNAKRLALLRSNYVKTMAASGDQVALALEPLRKSVKEQGLS